MTKTEIETSIKTIREIMDRQVGIEDPGAVLQKLNDCGNVLGLSGELIAQSKRLYNQKMKSMIGELFQMKTTDRKLKMDVEATEQQFLLDQVMALNKDLHYSVEACRSMLSYLKQEMNKIG